jgi:dUTP pyrophosphatase
MMNQEEILKQIYSQFENLQQKYGETPDENPELNIEDIIGDAMESLQQELLSDSMKTTLGIQRIHGDAVLPKYAYPSDSGFDLCSVEEVVLEPFGRAAVPTGLTMAIPVNSEIQIRPKSGLALNQGLTVLNTPGTVDAGYTGEIKVIVFNTNNHQIKIPVGMKIAQAVLCPVFSGQFVNLIEVDDVETKDRGENGFGSTGINL